MCLWSPQADTQDKLYSALHTFVHVCTHKQHTQLPCTYIHVQECLCTHHMHYTTRNLHKFYIHIHTHTHTHTHTHHKYIYTHVHACPAHNLLHYCTRVHYVQLLIFNCFSCSGVPMTTTFARLLTLSQSNWCMRHTKRWHKGQGAGMNVCTRTYILIQAAVASFPCMLQVVTNTTTPPMATAAALDNMPGSWRMPLHTYYAWGSPAALAWGCIGCKDHPTKRGESLPYIAGAPPLFWGLRETAPPVTFISRALPNTYLQPQ